MLHTLARSSDESALASNSTLPHFVRFKSQSLCQYLHVSKDGEGRLTFSGKMDHMDPTVVFETVHVHTLRNLKPEGRKGIKIKSLATNKYWKRIANYKISHGKVAQDGKVNNAGSTFNSVMAIADTEEDGDLFDFETEEMTKIGAESKKIALRNPIDMRFLAPFSESQNNFAHKGLHFLGYMSKEKSWKESLLIVEVVVGPRVLWPVGITPESALATHILSHHVEPYKPIDQDDLPSTIILSLEQKSLLLGLETSELPTRKRSVDQILIEEPTKSCNSSNLDDITKIKKESLKEVKFDIGVSKKASKTTEVHNKRRSMDNILIVDSIQPMIPSKSVVDKSKKRATYTSSPMKAPRKLSPEEMAILYADSPDQGFKPDPGMIENISQFQSELITYMSVDWAKDWIYSQTGKGDHNKKVSSSQLKSNPTSIARFESSNQISHHSSINSGKGGWCYKIPQSFLEEDKKEKLGKGEMLDTLGSKV